MKVLFICQGNINRSQVAEAVYRSLVPDADVTSAGIYVDHEGEKLADIPGGSVEAMRERGFDISSQVSKHVTPEMVNAADRIVVLGEIPMGPVPDYIQNSAKVEQWDIADPGYGRITIDEACDLVIEKVTRMLRSNEPSARS